MAVFRVEKTRDYTVMSNHHLRNHNLSLKAKGLLSQMLSLPEEWDYTLEGLAKLNGDGKDSIRSAVQELEKTGYIQRRRTKDENGKFGGNEYVIYEQPVAAAPSSDFPTMEKPTLEKPSLENPTQLNTKGLNTNIPPISPQGDDVADKPKRRSRGYKAQAETLPERFEKFWTFYRTHVPPDCNAGNRQKAIRAWDKLAPSDELVTAMAGALAKQVKSQSWTAGVGVPHASTWLNNHGWEDDWGPAADAVPEQAAPPGRDEEWL